MWIKPSSTASETFNVNMNTFDDGQPEEFLSLLRNFKIAIDGTGTTTPSGRINYLCMMLCGQALRDFNKLKYQCGGATNNHLKLIQEVLHEYFFPINALYKKKRLMRRTLRKPQSMTLKCFAARLTEINKLPPLLTGSDASKKMEMEDLNEIILHAVPNGWAKKSYLQGWYFEQKTYRETCAMFECMEVTEKVYKEVTLSKIPTRADANLDGHVRKRKGGEAASPINPKKVRAGKRKTNNVGNPSDAPTGAKKPCLLHGPGQSSEECKLFKVYYEKCAGQRPHKPTEACSYGKPKRGKAVEFDNKTRKSTPWKIMEILSQGRKRE